MLKTLTIAAGAALLLATPALACNDITSKTIKLTACADTEWVAGTGTGAQEFVYTTADQNFGLMVITESQAFDSTKFHDAIIANAVHGIGDKPDDVKVVSERIENIDGKPFNVLEYTVANNGSPILFQNFYFSQPGVGSVQILAYSLEPDGAAAAFKAGIFASTVKVGD
jgi:hypothetical protein